MEKRGYTEKVYSVCPCCGYRTLDGEEGNNEICPVCFWEDDPIQRKDPHYWGGANHVSLVEARKNYEKYGAVEERFVRFVRKPLREEAADGSEEVGGADHPIIEKE